MGSLPVSHVRIRSTTLSEQVLALLPAGPDSVMVLVLNLAINTGNFSHTSPQLPEDGLGQCRLTKKWNRFMKLHVILMLIFSVSITIYLTCSLSWHTWPLSPPAVYTPCWQSDPFVEVQDRPLQYAVGGTVKHHKWGGWGERPHSLLLSMKTCLELLLTSGKLGLQPHQIHWHPFLSSSHLPRAAIWVVFNSGCSLAPLP